SALADSIEEIGEQWKIKRSSFRMLLHPDGIRVRADSCLFDYSVARGPGLDLNSVGQPLERLVMRAVHRSESMNRLRAMSERLYIRSLRVVMAGNINMQGPAHRDIQHLQTSANRQDRLS